MATHSQCAYGWRFCTRATAAARALSDRGLKRERKEEEHSQVMRVPHRILYCTPCTPLPASQPSTSAPTAAPAAPTSARCRSHLSSCRTSAKLGRCAGSCAQQRCIRAMYASSSASGGCRQGGAEWQNKAHVKAHSPSPVSDLLAAPVARKASCMVAILSTARLLQALPGRGPEGLLGQAGLAAHLQSHAEPPAHMNSRAQLQACSGSCQLG